jgi:hypothetical protein
MKSITVLLLLLAAPSLFGQDSLWTSALMKEFTFPTEYGGNDLSLERGWKKMLPDPPLVASPFDLRADGVFRDQSPDPEGTDSSQTLAHRRLLPENMSFMERGLWGENGFFRKIGIAGPLSVESRKEELSARRTMLTMHQVGGVVTLGLMVSAVYCGQQVLNGHRGYRSWHQGFVTGTIIAYSTTGLLAVLSPPPLIRRDEFSTITLHKTLAWVHFVGMVVTPILGASLHHNHTLNYDQLARYHQISAYITASALLASMLVITF